MRETLGVPDKLPPGAPGAAAGGGEQVELPKVKEPKSTPAMEARKPDPEGGESENDGDGGQGEVEKSAGSEAGAPVGPKPVRSLRKSERGPRKDPLPKRSTQADGKLPSHKHSDGDLERIRRQNALQTKPPVDYIVSQAAHWSLLVLGYLLAFAGGIGGLLVALFLFLKKPRSHHHAALITIIAVLVLAFGILYLLPKTDGP